MRGLGEERLKRFFVRTERGWRVSQAVRDLCVFVRHDVARDPPFSRLDLVSCRNVLIYFGQVLQRRVLATAHYCLNQPGYLLLGRSESAAGVPRLFTPASKGGRLFLRKPGPSTFRFAPRAGRLPRHAAPLPHGRRGPSEGRRGPRPARRRRGPGPVRAARRGRQRTSGGAPVSRTDRSVPRAAGRASRRASSSRWRAPASPPRCASRSPRPQDLRPGAEGAHRAGGDRRWPDLRHRRAPGEGRRRRGARVRGALRGAASRRGRAPWRREPGRDGRARLGVTPGARGGARLHEGVRRLAARGARSQAPTRSPRPTTSSSRATRSSRASTRSWRPPRRSSRRPTRSSPRSTTSSTAGTRTCSSSTPTSSTSSTRSRSPS